MNRFILCGLAALLSVFASSAYAGGPVAIDDDVEMIVEKPASSVGILPLLLIPIILCVALCGNDDDDTLMTDT